MIDVNKVKAVVDADYEDLCIGCFAHWVSALFCKYDGFTFEENKTAFFYLIERLLRERKVRFGDFEDWSWNASPEDMVAHLKKGWPEDVAEEGDMRIVDYFYDLDRCPPISWLGEDGKLHSS